MEGNANLSFTKLAEVSGVSEASCRRYTKKAPQVFMAAHRDGVTRFPQEAVERFRAAQKALAEGMRWGEAMRLLQEQFGAVYDVGLPAEGETEATGDALALREIGPKLDRLVVAVEALAAAQRETVELLKAQQVQLAEARVEHENTPPQGGFWRSLVHLIKGKRFV